MKKIILIALLISAGNAGDLCLFYLNNLNIKMQEMNQYFDVGMHEERCSSAHDALYYAVKADVICDYQTKKVTHQSVKILDKVNKFCNERNK